MAFNLPPSEEEHDFMTPVPTSTTTTAVMTEGQLDSTSDIVKIFHDFFNMGVWAVALIIFLATLCLCIYLKCHVKCTRQLQCGPTLSIQEETEEKLCRERQVAEENIDILLRIMPY